MGSKNFDNLKKAKLAYHHFDERICQMWYDSKARQFPVSIDITMATQCNYDMSDLVSDKKGIYRSTRKHGKSTILIKYFPQRKKIVTKK